MSATFHPETFRHETVLLGETLDAIRPRAGGVYADATLGGGGHAHAILERSAPSGRLIGLDRDEVALSFARERLAQFGDRVTLVHGAFSELRAHLTSIGVSLVDGVVADIGVSSPQLDDAERGFSFRAAGPLDMRMDRSSGETARELIDRLDEDELANVIYQLGEERKSRRIARSIKAASDEGRLETTDDLRAAIHRVTGRPPRGIDPATRTFQALRIAVNEELDELDALLAQLPEVLADEGVGVIISFHSLEDRRVKRAFRGDPRLSPLTKRPQIASDEERDRNPRSRSAKLRAATRVARGEEEAA